MCILSRLSTIWILHVYIISVEYNLNTPCVYYLGWVQFEYSMCILSRLSTIWIPHVYIISVEYNLNTPCVYYLGWVQFEYPMCILSRLSTILHVRIGCGKSWVLSPSGSNQRLLNGSCCFSAKHIAYRSESKDWLGRSHNNVSEWDQHDNVYTVSKTMTLTYNWASL